MSQLEERECKIKMGVNNMMHQKNRRKGFFVVHVVYGLHMIHGVGRMKVKM